MGMNEGQQTAPKVLGERENLSQVSGRSEISLSVRDRDGVGLYL